MPTQLGDLSRPGLKASAYIRSETPGLVAECNGSLISLKYFEKLFNYFINYLETWSQVCSDRFCFFVLPVSNVFSFS